LKSIKRSFSLTPLEQLITLADPVLAKTDLGRLASNKMFISINTADLQDTIQG
jgi:hypothetical protein